MPTAVVTGASRGVGRGAAIALHSLGYRVYATGRTVASADLPADIVRVTCDHTRDADTAAAFERVVSEAGSLDILVNSAWGGYEQMVENGALTWCAPFWEQPMHRWNSMFDAGVRAAFVAAAHAVRLMLPRRAGLIANISFQAARQYTGNVLYGMSKAATDKMTSDMAHELRSHGISVVSIHPGMVRTEAVLAAAAGGWLNLEGSESPELQGRVIAALAADPNLAVRSGQVLVTKELATEYGIQDS
ncbi:MAG TPA: SDR family NAD(P)-dependent oxidoreductase [Candidatus Solibacter sp.]|nr:SDR family NAD(P)-dependent oxidoreductase [Candidatus Solibacter sp.]